MVEFIAMVMFTSAGHSSMVVGNVGYGTLSMKAWKVRKPVQKRPESIPTIAPYNFDFTN